MSREPVAKLAAMEGVGIALIALVASLAEWDPEVQAAVTAVLSAVVVAVGAWLARANVTPIDDPRDDDGNQLVVAVETADDT